MDRLERGAHALEEFAAAFEGVANQAGDVAFVLDDQHPRTGGLSGRRTACPAAQRQRIARLAAEARWSGTAEGRKEKLRKVTKKAKDEPELGDPDRA